MSQCNATSKRTGERCRAQAVTGNATCRHHGGRSQKGPASGTWIDGRSSTILPKHLRETYQASLSDPDRLTLDAEIALVDARINDLLAIVDSGESGRIWTALQREHTAMEAAQAAKNVEITTEAQASLADLIRDGHAEWTTWAEVGTLIDRRRRLVASERRRLVETQQTVTVEQALALLGLLVSAVHRHVRDEEALCAIVEEYARLTGQPIPTEVPPAIPVRRAPRRRR